MYEEEMYQRICERDSKTRFSNNTEKKYTLNIKAFNSKHVRANTYNTIVSM